MLYKKIVFSNIMSRFILKALIVLLILGFNSCKWFDSKQAITDRIIKQDMQTIDWNQIDRYPLFANCDESASKVSQERCFVSELQLHFKNIIDALKTDHSTELIELESVVFQVDAKGALTIVKVAYKDQMERTTLDSLMQNGLNHLPPLYPAIKRGVPVKVTYKMPFKVAVKH